MQFTFLYQHQYKLSNLPGEGWFWCFGGNFHPGQPREFITDSAYLYEMFMFQIVYPCCINSGQSKILLNFYFHLKYSWAMLILDYVLCYVCTSLFTKEPQSKILHETLLAIEVILFWEYRLCNVCIYVFCGNTNFSNEMSVFYDNTIFFEPEWKHQCCYDRVCYCFITFLFCDHETR